MQGSVVSGIRPRFRGLSQSQGQITHVLLTRSPLEYPRKGLSARLACVKHAASVRPEPGSNPPLKTKSYPRQETLTNCQNHRQRKPRHHQKDSANGAKIQTNSSTMTHC